MTAHARAVELRHAKEEYKATEHKAQTAHWQSEAKHKAKPHLHKSKSLIRDI